MNEQLLKKVVKGPRLPSLPAVALELIDLAQQPDVEISRLADAVRSDPALSSKVLRTVNSSFYAQAETISTISRALVVLGLNAVRTLALGFTLVGNLRRAEDGSFDHVRYWRRSLYTASAAQTLSEYVSLSRREETFLGGLFQDIGIIAMCQTLGKDYTALVQEAGDDHGALCALEHEAFGFDHAEAGAALAERWSLPPMLVAPIRYHEAPDGAAEDVRSLVRCVALGNRVAEIFLSDEENGRALDRYHTQIAAWFDVSRDLADPILHQIHERTQEMGRLFELPTGDLGNPDEILARANETLTEITLQSQLQSTELRRQNQRLVDEVLTDPLTGALNRRAFAAYLDDQFPAASAERPLSVLFADVDHFRKFNNTYGHPVGDRVLKAFTMTLGQVARETGRVFRYGGEEFAIVCPETDGEAASALAEHVRVAVEGTTRVRARDCEDALGVTCSIGVATHAGTTHGDAEALVKAADDALYAAKSSGRNCVRAWNPGPSAGLSREVAETAPATSSPQS